MLDPQTFRTSRVFNKTFDCNDPVLVKVPVRAIGIGGAPTFSEDIDLVVYNEQHKITNVQGVIINVLPFADFASPNTGQQTSNYAFQLKCSSGYIAYGDSGGPFSIKTFHFPLLSSNPPVFQLVVKNTDGETPLENVFIDFYFTNFKIDPAYFSTGYSA